MVPAPLLSSLSPCGRGWAPLPALQDARVQHQQHGVQRGRGPAAHRDPVGESGHRPGHLAHGRALGTSVAIYCWPCLSAEPWEGELHVFWQVGALLTPRASSGDLELIFFCWKQRQDPLLHVGWLLPVGEEGGFGGGGLH